VFRNYLTTALRNLRKQKLFTLLNLAGLALGLTCCLLIALYVQHELSYDTFHEKADRIARVTMEIGMEGTVNKVAYTGTKVAAAFSADFPEVEKAVKVINNAAVVRAGDQLFEEKDFYYADSTFFEVFSFPLRRGDPATVLAGPQQLVLTESAARKYFGNTDAVGQTLRINDSKDFTVTGVVADPPANSQMKFSMVASFSSLQGIHKVIQWYSANYITYLLLQRPDAITSLQAKIPAYMQAQSEDTHMTGENYLTFNLEPLTSVHLHSGQAGFEPNSDITYVYIISAIALLILTIACVNYTNLTTAQATSRAKEVGMRKVMGAQQTNLFWQFIGESIIITFIALAVSMLLVTLLLPAFNAVTDRQIHFSLIRNPELILLILGTGLLVSLLAGSYPALVLSGFQPIRVLKGNFRTSGSGILLRKTLIVFQFVISTFLIIGTLIVQQQLGFIQNRKLGYDKEHILVLPSDQKIAGSLETVKTEFKQHPNVRHVTLAYDTPAFIKAKYQYRAAETPADQAKMVTAIPVDKDFLQTIGLELIAGSDFTEADALDAQKPGDDARYTYILNEAAVRELGWTPEEAIGRRMVLNQEGVIRGVVKDFHFESMRQNISPLVIFMEKLWGGDLMVKMSGDDVGGTIRFLESKWNTLAPHRPFEYRFLDE
jgi:putative ABC transport system permease protein